MNLLKEVLKRKKKMFNCCLENPELKTKNVWDESVVSSFHCVQFTQMFLFLGNFSKVILMWNGSIFFEEVLLCYTLFLFLAFFVQNEKKNYEKSEQLNLSIEDFLITF